MSARPLWFRLDCDIAEHPTIMQLQEQREYEALWAYVILIAYCTRHLTDGVVPRELPGRLGIKRRTLQVLVRNELLSDTVPAGFTGWFLPGFLDRQPSADEWQTMISKKRNAALTRWSTRGNVTRMAN